MTELMAQTICWEFGAERRTEMGITDGPVRLSVGIEPAADLRAGLESALAPFNGEPVATVTTGRRPAQGLARRPLNASL
jgi:hypothetical protein